MLYPQQSSKHGRTDNKPNGLKIVGAIKKECRRKNAVFEGIL
jgi:hypothetical protein